MLFSTLSALAGAFLAVVAFLAAGFFSAAFVAALAGALSSFLATVLTSTAF